jgi:hypothetical protein
VSQIGRATSAITPVVADALAWLEAGSIPDCPHWDGSSAVEHRWFVGYLTGCHVPDQGPADPERVVQFHPVPRLRLQVGCVVNPCGIRLRTDPHGDLGVVETSAVMVRERQ